MDFSLFKNAHGTLSTFGELTRGMDESHVTYFKAIPNYNQQDAMFLDLFISTDALHVSSGSSAHHQEHITVHTASGTVNQYCCLLQQTEVFVSILYVIYRCL